MLEGITVVISPLLSLIEDQTDKLDAAGIATTRLDSTLTTLEERGAMSEIRRGDRLLYLTPERLERPEVVALLRKSGVALLVVDEAHCVSQWGHDFRPAYLSIRDAVKALGNPPVLALTATATPELEKDIVAQLGIPNAEVVRTEAERANIFFEVQRTPNDEKKLAALVDLLKGSNESAIVYTATIASAESLHETLRACGIDVTLYHGRLNKAARRENQHAFMTGETRVIVATSAFGLGIDKPDVRLVVHYMFPDSLESYYQEAGRAGRDGAPARAVLLYRLEDRRVRAYFLGGKYPKQDALIAVYQAIRAWGGTATLGSLAKETKVSQRRVKVIVAELDAMGVIRRGGGKVDLVRDFVDGAELARFATAYESRFETDREKLEDMMHYAQSTACRVRRLVEYFGEEPVNDCGHCDNCRDQPAHNAAVAAHAAGPTEVREPAGLAFGNGDRVEHSHFGIGVVAEVTPEHVRVLFADVGEKTVHADYLESLS